MSRGSDGLGLIAKPPGITSFHTLDELKKRMGTRRVGHGGTLDKFATGLLICLYGSYTRVSDLFAGLDKTYEAVFTFGKETDTLDPEGSVVREAPLPGACELHAAAACFLGRIMQRPPCYSAVHVQGRRAYERTLRKEAFDIPPREIAIHEFSLLDWDPPHLEVRIRCSKGTYVRSLARDLAERVGSAAFVSALRRTAIGPFPLAEARDPADFLPSRDGLDMQAAAARLSTLMQVRLKAGFENHFRRGGRLEPGLFLDAGGAEGLHAVFASDGGFLGTVRWEGSSIRYGAVISSGEEPGA